jgi:hypothetical protein
MKFYALAFGILFFCSQGSWGALQIPKNLSVGEQELILQILGFSTSFKPLDSPCPLGGYSGLELGLGFENVSTGDIGDLGQTAAVDKNLIYPRLTLGKGIFSNIDLFFSFMPYNESTGIGIYSGAIRWGFFQATFVPANFSLLISSTNTNVDNLFISQTIEADLITGVNLDSLSFYVGAGALYGQGQFDYSVTADGSNNNTIGRAFHTMIGANFAVSQLFTAVEVDSYNNTTVSMKIGTRL